MDAQLQLIPIDEIQPAPDNIRSKPGDVKELAASIAAVGVLEPVLATKDNGHYVLVAGGRRLAAAQLAGLDAIPTIVREFDERTRVEAMLIENLQRHDLSTLEEARAYRRLVDLGLSQRDLAQRIGRSQSHISKRLALLELPDEVAEQVDSGGITVSDAVHLTKLKDTPELVLEAIGVGDGRFNYMPVEDRVDELLERKQRGEKIAAETAKAEAEGLRVVAFTGDGYYPTLPKGVVKISKGGGYDAIRVDVGKHAELECHAVAIEPNTLQRIAVCTDRKKSHPKAKTDQERQREQYSSTSRRSGSRPSKEDAEAQKAEAEALGQAEERRQAFYGEIVKAKHPKDDVIKLALRAFLNDRTMIGEVDTEIACKAVGIPDQRVYGRNQLHPLLEYADKGERELLQVAHALALAIPEIENFGQWNPHAPWGDEERKHLELLEQHGYELSDIERKKLGTTTKRKDR